MEATLTITGNQRDGYKVKVELPAEWCAKFTQRLGVEIWGQSLYGKLGSPSPDGKMCIMHYGHNNLSDARRSFDKAINDIKAAKKILAQVCDVLIEKAIDLGDSEREGEF